MAITTKRPPPSHPLSANRDAAIEITSSPDPEPIEEPRPATRSRSTAKRTATATANPVGSGLASPPPSPPFQSATTPKPKPKPTPKPRARPVVKKLAAFPENVVVLSDSSDDEKVTDMSASPATTNGTTKERALKDGEELNGVSNGVENGMSNGKDVPKGTTDESSGYGVGAGSNGTDGAGGNANGKGKAPATRKFSANFDFDSEEGDGGPSLAATKPNMNAKGKIKASFSAAHAYDDSDSDEDGPFSTSRRPVHPLEPSQPLDTPTVDVDGNATGPAKEPTPFDDDFYTDDEGPGVVPPAPQPPVPAAQLSPADVRRQRGGRRCSSRCGRRARWDASTASTLCPAHPSTGATGEGESNLAASIAFSSSHASTSIASEANSSVPFSFSF
ncbi:hypothetical protein FA13DRAFT_1787313 [Coprinellus micaceus]|uniref:Uncharacterized protein n=1 Tax=Coprinellus micaceus TaxID=71717 RepID=A0A4Y7TS92_COPMI|nr:hypothetical protein FA13DRAFT_1787313 [Coprinellus micaceus]